MPAEEAGELDEPAKTVGVRMGGSNVVGREREA